MWVSENCDVTHQGCRLALTWEPYRPLLKGDGTFFGDDLPRTWPESRRLLYTTRCREGKMEIPVEVRSYHCG
jgi:hypothetical protein